VAPQIEYSLLERTVEGDLMPMALEMGMGVTPWSPLKGGILSGKYTRTSAAPTEGRGTSPWVANQLNERTYTVIDVLVDVAKQAGATPAQVALAWVQSRPGVVSSIIGARTEAQLDDNLAALGVTLSPAQVSLLNEATRPVLSFPHVFLDFVSDNVQGGTTVNGRSSKVWPLAPQTDAERH
jgi:aryl-alcohol dehydrogenase-like predicted oxidoreductase